MGRVRFPKQQVRDDDFMSSECFGIVFILAKVMPGCLLKILQLEFRDRHNGEIEAYFTCSIYCDI